MNSQVRGPFPYIGSDGKTYQVMEELITFRTADFESEGASRGHGQSQLSLSDGRFITTLADGRLCIEGTSITLTKKTS